MRIGIDLRMCSYTGSGFSRFAQGLVHSIVSYGTSMQWTFLTHGPEFDLFKSENIAVDRISTPLFSKNEGKELEQIAITKSLDLIHLPFSLYPADLNCPVLLTISDLSPLDYPQTIPEAYLSFYQQGINRSKSATLLHLLSSEIKSAILQRKLVQESYIRVVAPISPFESDSYFSLNLALESTNESISGPFILSVGTVSPRKNYLGALRILEKAWQRERLNFRWIIAGWDHEGDSEFKEALTNSAFRDRVSILPNVSDFYLISLYKQAICLLNCSVHEGYYFPALEALYLDCPLISVPVPALTSAGITESESLIPSQLEKSIIIFSDLLNSKSSERNDRISSKVRDYYTNLPQNRFITLYQEALNLLNLT